MSSEPIAYLFNAPYMNVEAPDIAGDCEQGLRHLFFSPDLDEIPESRVEARKREHQARQVCRDCPVLYTCALHGLEGEEYGVWGGLSETDRAALGGTGRPASPGQRTVKRVISNLYEAGFTFDQVVAILRLWKARKAELATDAERGAA